MCEYVTQFHEFAKEYEDYDPTSDIAATQELFKLLNPDPSGSDGYNLVNPGEANGEIRLNRSVASQILAYCNRAFRDRRVVIDKSSMLLQSMELLSLISEYLQELTPSFLTKTGALVNAAAKDKDKGKPNMIAQKICCTAALLDPSWIDGGIDYHQARAFVGHAQHYLRIYMRGGLMLGFGSTGNRKWDDDVHEMFGRKEMLGKLANGKYKPFGSIWRELRQMRKIYDESFSGMKELDDLHFYQPGSNSALRDMVNKMDTSRAMTVPGGGFPVVDPAAMEGYLELQRCVRAIAVLKLSSYLPYLHEFAEDPERSIKPFAKLLAEYEDGVLPWKDAYPGMD